MGRLLRAHIAIQAQLGLRNPLRRHSMRTTALTSASPNNSNAGSLVDMHDEVRKIKAPGRRRAWATSSAGRGTSPQQHTPDAVSAASLRADDYYKSGAGRVAVSRACDFTRGAMTPQRFILLSPRRRRIGTGVCNLGSPVAGASPSRIHWRSRGVRGNLDGNLGTLPTFLRVLGGRVTAAGWQGSQENLE